jgi:hypothetical protein
MRLHLPAWLLVSVYGAVLPPSTLGQKTQRGEPKDRSDFTLLKEEGFPLNVDPEIVPASEAPLEEGDMVLGVVIEGEPRAYPVNYMNGPTNEVVNDTLAGAAIAPSW